MLSQLKKFHTFHLQLFCEIKLRIPILNVVFEECFGDS